MFVCPECGQTQAEPGFCRADGTAVFPTSDDPLLGQMVGSYRVARLIGAGGMGQVYKGVHPTIGSRVAIKVLSGDGLGDAISVERFFAEARAVNLIRHENIVNVLDLAWLPGRRPYIVMEYLDGAPLSALIRQRKGLPLGGLVRLVGEVLDALGAAHGKGIVHRDLKPDNVFVTPAAHAKVLDFGIAKLRPELSAAQGATPTRTGSILGTPYYMSPEQALSRPVDARSDLYSVGIMLFEGVAGRVPFVGDALFEVLKQHIEARPMSVRSIRPDVPPALESAINKALEKDPALRFQSAAEFGSMLAQILPFLPSESFGALAANPSVIPAWTGRSQGPNATTGGTQMASRAPSAAVGPGGGAALVTTGSPTQNPTPLGAAQKTGSTLPSPQNPVALSSSMDGRVSMPATPPHRFWTGMTVGFLVFGALGICVVGAILVIGGIVYYSQFASQEKDKPRPTQSTGNGSETTEEDDTEPESKPGDSTSIFGDLTTVGGRLINARPSWFDPHKVDPDRVFQEAEKLAKARFPDAQLVRFDITGMNGQGYVDTTVSGTFSSSITVSWRSPSKSKPPAGYPINAEYKAECSYFYNVSSDGVIAYPVGHMPCTGDFVKVPHCKARQIWAKAVAQGAPASNVIGNISWYGWQGKPATWRASIANFSAEINDDCTR